MELLSLNDDVLYAIADKLYGENALNLALTSRRIHDLAVHRVSAIVVCMDATQLRLLHRYLLFGSRPRVQYLQSLTVWSSAFSVDGDDYYEHSARRLSDDEAYDSEIRLLVDILTSAHNLRFVFLPFFHPAVTRNPRLGDALCALRFLTSVRLDTVGDTMVTTLVPRLPRALRVLELVYHTYIADPVLLIPNEPSTFRPLLDTLAAFPVLHTFRLRNLEDAVSFRDLGRAYVPPHLPAVRSLVLEKVHPAALDIVQLCPSLKYLEIQLWRTQDPFAGVVLREGATWPPLRSLDVNDIGDLTHAISVLGRARSLVIRSYVCVGDPANVELALLLDVVERTSPTAAFFSLEVGPQPMSFWGKVAKRAPHLRILELKLSTEALTLNYRGWLDAVPNALRPLSATLRLVRIILPQMEHHSRFGAAYGHEVKRSLVAALEEDRICAAQVLPWRLADALPVLRFVGVCEAVPTWNRSGRTEYRPEIRAESHQDEASVSGAEDDGREAEAEAEELCLNAHTDEHSDLSDEEYSIASWSWGTELYDEVDEQESLSTIDTEQRETPVRYRWISRVAYQRQWRVRPNDNAQGRVLEEISEAEMDRAQRFLEEADDEEAARVDEHFP